MLTGTSGPGQSKQEDFSSSPLPELTAIPGDRELQHRKPLDRDVSLGRFLWLFTTYLQTLKQRLGATGITGARLPLGMVRNCFFCGNEVVLGWGNPPAGSWGLQSRSLPSSTSVALRGQGGPAGKAEAES